MGSRIIIGLGIAWMSAAFGGLTAGSAAAAERCAKVKELPGAYKTDECTGAESKLFEYAKVVTGGKLKEGIYECVKVVSRKAGQYNDPNCTEIAVEGPYTVVLAELIACGEGEPKATHVSPVDDVSLDEAIFGEAWLAPV